MVDVAISALPASGALTGAELIPEVQGGTTKRTTAAAIAALRLPAGATKQIQFNNAGALGAQSQFTYDPATGAISSIDPTSAGRHIEIEPNGSSSTALTLTNGAGVLVVRTDAGNSAINSTVTLSFGAQGSITLLPTTKVDVQSNLEMSIVGKTLGVKGGAGSRCGIVNLSSGTASVAIPSVTANSIPIAVYATQSGTNGQLSVSVSAGVGLNFDSGNPLDNNSVFYFVIEQT